MESKINVLTIELLFRERMPVGGRHVCVECLSLEILQVSYFKESTTTLKDSSLWK